MHDKWDWSERISAQRESFSQVNTSHLRIVAKFLRRSSEADFSIGNDVGTVRNRQRLADVMIRDENTDPARLQIKNDLLKVEHCDGVNT